MNTNPQQYDAESFARIVLFHLASLRSEMIQTQRTVTEILAHQNDETRSQFEKSVKDQELKKAKERDRIFQVTLEMAKIPHLPMPPSVGDIHWN